jgi:hypothetical protein
MKKIERGRKGGARRIGNLEFSVAATVLSLVYIVCGGCELEVWELCGTYYL